ncbi:deoxyguanosinetriphosphate triphosphohydrolase-like protein [Sphingobacterium faecium NBRC 15299]|uniref:dGTP triphosphohydrolase n=1 Tax=Sphingobacterium faecium TaxID=34087 RepID=UPI000D3C90CA|nr:dNTP triphosphohydrolase [Sphingobacterium faecium]PTX14109.1 dGTPase [Sphingobacterium faecium]GEM64189.1 deoxyguanosinetriphosphate triphosphohydrolase-like protein [Sphingobacterium faecium NBRC 15299]
MNWNNLLSEKRIRKSSIKHKRDIRNNYESDLGRIIFSPALRRMHDKTQVFPLTDDDNIHTRLTHSNEVMSLSYTFGLKCAKSSIIQHKTGMNEADLLRIIPIILQGISFIHDIGNPPFGHFAEEVIANYFDKIDCNPLIHNEVKQKFKKLTPHQKNDFKFYDGNAQGLRMITKLQYLDDVFGMNLTYSILGSYLKYPNSYTKEIDKSKKDELKELKKQKKANIAEGKHGVFHSEDKYFKKIIKECGLTDSEGRIIRHPLCFLMEAADTIAYRVMDIEDGFSKGYITINCIKEAFSKNTSEIAKTIVQKCDEPNVNDEARMIFVRIALIDYLVTLAFKNFENNIDHIEKGKYHNELVEHDDNNIHQILSDICKVKIFSTREVNHLETTGYSVIKGLLNHYINQLFNTDKKFINRATALISSSIINVALEEDMLNFIALKYDKLKSEKGEIIIKKKLTEKEYVTKMDDLKEKIDSYLSLILKSENDVEITYDPIKKLRTEIYKAFNDLGNQINFQDLSDYYKLRVIVDFISGMTDKYALSHFQKISGQKIA